MNATKVSILTLCGVALTVAVGQSTPPVDPESARPAVLYRRDAQDADASSPVPGGDGQLEPNLMLLDDAARRISFQALLTNEQGGPISQPNGEHELDFRLYDSEAGGVPIGMMLDVVVTLDGGIASTQVGPMDPTWFDGTARWMGVTVDNGDELEPLIPLGSVPYAFRVDRVASAELDDDIELGDSATAGSMIVHAGVGSQAMELHGANRTLRLLDQSGAARVVLQGDDGFAMVGGLMIESEAGVNPMAVQRSGQPNTDLLINNQGQVAIGNPGGTLAKLTVNSDGEEPFRVRINGVTQFVVANDGQVGVGTSVPAAKLHVDGNRGENLLEIRRFGTLTPTLRVTEAGEVIVGEELGVSALFTVNAAAGDDAVRVRTDGTTRFVVAQDGQVGVGTSIPTARLQINGGNRETVLEVRPFGTTIPALRVTDTAAVIIGDETGTNAKLTVNAPAGEDPFRIRTDGTTKLIVKSDGDVGIGTSSPASLLHLVSQVGIDLLIEADTNNIGETQNARIVLSQDGGQVVGRIGYRSGENRLEIMQEFGDSLILGTNGSDRLTITSSGRVGIGTADIPSDSLLAVDGKVRCEEVEVQLSEDWPDYVFEDGYELLPLDELAKSIERTGHLPGIPSAADVAEQGLRIGHMQARTIEKIEELTLYVLSLHEELKQVRGEREDLMERLAKVEAACH